MSADTKANIETVYKAIIVMLLSFCSFFLVKASNQIDDTMKRVQKLEIDVAVILSQTKK